MRCILFLFLVVCAGAEVVVQHSAQSWTIRNEKITLEMSASAGSPLQAVSLRNVSSKSQWVSANSPSGVSLEWAEPSRAGMDLGYVGGETKDASRGGKELVLHFAQKGSTAKVHLHISCFPNRAALEFMASIENAGHEPLRLIRRISPLTIAIPASGTKVYKAADKEDHGFRDAGSVTGAVRSTNWVVLERSGESLLVGGDLGAGVLEWQVDLEPSNDSVAIRAGVGFPQRRGKLSNEAFELPPGSTAETPISFLALTKGDADDAGNEAFRYLKQYVFPKPLPNSPLAAYCIWYTIPRSEDYLLDELKFAQRTGFDVFYHDASWYEGSSLVPGTNDWASGLGSYVESAEKFPSGLKHLSDAVRGAGMKFGLWVDPGNVDSARVQRGEIPDAWLAKIDGKPLESRHPSLAPMTQLCLGNPEVVAAVKKNLSSIIERWNLEWIKWDPSGTVNNNCTRTDHGHGRYNGAYSAWKGKMEIWAYLLERYPQLSGFECDPSLRYARTNPGPRSVLPGGYECEFITGPMVSPYVWGSPYSAKGELGNKWYSASALDYDIRKHFTHGFVFGNIDGMLSQRLSAAPPGYIEAFQRNLLWFKRYRHLLTEDVYHPALSATSDWSATEYVKQDGSEAVVFVFRRGGTEGTSHVKLRGLTTGGSYRVTSLNERPGRDQIITAADLANNGALVTLPNNWLAKGDGLPAGGFEDQLQYGSDILLLEKK